MSTHFKIKEGLLHPYPQLKGPRNRAWVESPYPHVKGSKWRKMGENG